MSETEIPANASTTTMTFGFGAADALAGPGGTTGISGLRFVQG
jgi:hypothetical protein